MKEVKYDLAYMFKYSERPRTLAQRKYEDDIPEETKNRRLQEIIAQHMEIAQERTKTYVGGTYKVLIEGVSKKSEDQLYGRTSENYVAVFDKGDLEKGMYVDVEVDDCTKVTLKGKVVKIYPKS